jgi:hypothetical protein
MGIYWRIILKEFCSFERLLGTCFSGADPGECWQGLRPMWGLLPVCMRRLDQPPPSARVTEHMGPVQSSTGTATCPAQRCRATTLLLFNWKLSTLHTHQCQHFPYNAGDTRHCSPLMFLKCMVLWMSYAHTSEVRNIGPSSMYVWQDENRDIDALCRSFAWFHNHTSMSIFFSWCSHTWELAPTFGAQGWVSSVSWSGTVGKTPWTDDQLVARPLPIHKHRKMHTHTQTLNIHALSGIQTHGPAFWTSKDSARPRPLGYCDRLYVHMLCLNWLLMKSVVLGVIHWPCKQSQIFAQLWILNWEQPVLAW